VNDRDHDIWIASVRMLGGTTWLPRTGQPADQGTDDDDNSDTDRKPAIEEG
jgi:hypothetical protein